MSDTLIGIIVTAVLTFLGTAAIAYPKIRGWREEAHTARIAAEAQLKKSEAEKEKADGDGDEARARTTQLLMQAAGQFVANALENSERFDKELTKTQILLSEVRMKLDAEIQARQNDQATIRHLQHENAQLRSRISELENELSRTRLDLETALALKRDKADGHHV